MHTRQLARKPRAVLSGEPAVKLVNNLPQGVNMLTLDAPIEAHSVPLFKYALRRYPTAKRVSDPTLAREHD